MPERKHFFLQEGFPKVSYMIYHIYVIYVIYQISDSHNLVWKLVIAEQNIHQPWPWPLLFVIPTPGYCSFRHCLPPWQSEALQTSLTLPMNILDQLAVNQPCLCFCKSFQQQIKKIMHLIPSILALHSNAGPIHKLTFQSYYQIAFFVFISSWDV